MTTQFYNFLRGETLLLSVYPIGVESFPNDLTLAGWKGDELIYGIRNGKVYPATFFAKSHSKSDIQILQEIQTRSWRRPL